MLYEACVAGSGRGSRWITRGRIRHEPHSAIASRSSDNVSVQGITHSSSRITGAKTHRCVALSERSDPASIRHFTPLYGQHSQRDAIVRRCADATSHPVKPRWSAPTTCLRFLWNMRSRALGRAPCEVAFRVSLLSPVCEGDLLGLAWLEAAQVIVDLGDGVGWTKRRQCAP